MVRMTLSLVLFRSQDKLVKVENIGIDYLLSPLTTHNPLYVCSLKVFWNLDLILQILTGNKIVSGDSHTLNILLSRIYMFVKV